MNKFIMRAVPLMALALGSTVHATTSQFRSPISLEWGTLHYPMPYVDTTWWYDLIPSDRKETVWEVDTWGGIYSRSATKSFYDKCGALASCPKNKVTRETASLSQLWFGQETFVGAEILPSAVTSSQIPREDIALAFAQITPRFEYDETGMYIGVHAERRFGKSSQWRVGLRASMPVKLINIEQTCGAEGFIETLDDVVQLRRINITGNANGGQDQFDFAARLDFLAALQIPNGTPLSSTPGSFVAQPFLQFGNGTVAVQTKAWDRVVNADNQNDAFVYVEGRSDGTPPVYPFRRASANITADALPVDGTLGNNEYAFFGPNTTDYADALGKNRAAQAQLFLVPKQDTTGNQNLNANANAVSQGLVTLVSDLRLSSRPVEDIFAAAGIALCPAYRTTGQGDLGTEIYGGYAPGDKWFADGVIGLLFPTGKRLKSARQIYAQTTGNNGHVELKVGVDGGWRPYDWFQFTVDAAYHYAFNRIERRAAPFTGSLTRNIGPTIDAKVHWSYVTMHADLNFFHPFNPEMGLTVGYELFAKQHDHVDICPTVATDFLGNQNQPLNPKILERNTNSLTNKLCAEVFHRWNYFELFAGASQILAGRNAMKETEAHIGMSFYF